MQSVSPVFSEEEVKFEQVIALDQPQYLPVICLPIDLHIANVTGEVEVRPRTMLAIRMRLDDEERAAIAAGADLVVTEMVFGNPFTPLNFQFCKSDERPLL